MTITVYFLGFRKSIEDQEAGVTACVLFIWLRVSALELANLGLIEPKPSWTDNSLRGLAAGELKPG